jgi:hypothetical protein
MANYARRPSHRYAAEPFPGLMDFGIRGACMLDALFHHASADTQSQKASSELLSA